MAISTRRELFPTDRGLVVRMLLAALAMPLALASGLLALGLVVSWRALAGVGFAAALGMIARLHDRRAARPAQAAAPTQAPAVHAIVERLCMLADLPKPRIVIEPEAQPNSWVVSVGRRPPRLHLTEGLLRTLEPIELEAVVAHELAHVAHRDAAVMTVIGGPGAALLRGGTELVRGGGWWLLLSSGVAATAIGWLASLGTRILSRYRELAADAAAAALTGHPAALAAALLKVADGMSAIPARDLRAVAARDAFHLLPVASGRDGPPLPATHPPLQARIARLERMEAALHRARPGSPGE